MIRIQGHQNSRNCRFERLLTVVTNRIHQRTSRKTLQNLMTRATLGKLGCQPRAGQRLRNDECL